MEEYKSLFKQNGVLKQKEKRNNDFVKIRKSRRSALFEVNREMKDYDDADISDIMETPKKITRRNFEKNKENVKLWKYENKKTTPKNQLRPFIVGVVRHKIHSPPFLHEPLNNLTPKNKNGTPKPLAPKNYQFKPPKGVKKLIFTPKKTSNSPFHAKSWETVTKKSAHENITVRSKVPKLTESMMQNSIFNFKDVETKNQNIDSTEKISSINEVTVFGQASISAKVNNSCSDESPVFGRANVLARMRQKEKNEVNSPVSRVNKELFTAKKQLYTDYCDRSSVSEEKNKPEISEVNSKLQIQECQKEMNHSSNILEKVENQNETGQRSSQTLSADLSKTNVDNINFENLYVKPIHDVHETAVDEFNSAYMESSFTDYLCLPELTPIVSGNMLESSSKNEQKNSKISDKTFLKTEHNLIFNVSAKEEKSVSNNLSTNKQNVTNANENSEGEEVVKNNVFEIEKDSYLKNYYPNTGEILSISADGKELKKLEKEANKISFETVLNSTSNFVASARLLDDDDLIENISDPTGNNFTTFSISSNNFLDATVKKLSNDQEILMNNVSAEKFNELDKESPPVESEAIFENPFSHENNDLNDTTNKYLNCSKATQESSSNIYAKDCTESVDNQGKKDMVVSEETNSMNDCICLTIPKNNEQEVQVNNINAEELHKLEKSPCSLEADTMSQSCIDNENDNVNANRYKSLNHSIEIEESLKNISAKDDSKAVENQSQNISVSSEEESSATEPTSENKSKNNHQDISIKNSLTVKSDNLEGESRSDQTDSNSESSINHEQDNLNTDSSESLSYAGINNKSLKNVDAQNNFESMNIQRKCVSEGSDKEDSRTGFHAVENTESSYHLELTSNVIAQELEIEQHAVEAGAVLDSPVNDELNTSKNISLKLSETSEESSNDSSAKRNSDLMKNKKVSGIFKETNSFTESVSLKSPENNDNDIPVSNMIVEVSKSLEEKPFSQEVDSVEQSFINNECNLDISKNESLNLNINDRISIKNIFAEDPVISIKGDSKRTSVTSRKSGDISFTKKLVLAVSPFRKLEKETDSAETEKVLENSVPYEMNSVNANRNKSLNYSYSNKESLNDTSTKDDSISNSSKEVNPTTKPISIMSPENEDSGFSISNVIAEELDKPVREPCSTRTYASLEDSTSCERDNLSTSKSESSNDNDASFKPVPSAFAEDNSKLLRCEESAKVAIEHVPPTSPAVNVEELINNVSVKVLENSEKERNSTGAEAVSKNFTDQEQRHFGTNANFILNSTYTAKSLSGNFRDNELPESNSLGVDIEQVTQSPADNVLKMPSSVFNTETSNSAVNSQSTNRSIASEKNDGETSASDENVHSNIKETSDERCQEEQFETNIESENEKIVKSTSEKLMSTEKTSEIDSTNRLTSPDNFEEIAELSLNNATPKKSNSLNEQLTITVADSISIQNHSSDSPIMVNTSCMSKNVDEMSKSISTEKCKLKNDLEFETSSVENLKANDKSIPKSSPEITGSLLVQKYITEKVLSTENSPTLTTPDSKNKVPKILIDLEDTARISVGDYKSPTLKNTNLRLQSNDNEVIDLVSDSEEDCSSFLSHVIAKHRPSCNSTPISKNIPKTVENVSKIHFSPTENPRPVVKKTIRKNLPELHISECQPSESQTSSCESPQLTTKESQVNSVGDDKRVYSLRARKINVTPSPTKKPRKTPKKVNRTPLKILEENIPEEAASTIKVNNTPLKILPPPILEENFPEEVASPVRVMSLRGRNVNISPSPNKTTPSKKTPLKEDCSLFLSHEITKHGPSCNSTPLSKNIPKTVENVSKIHFSPIENPGPLVKKIVRKNLPVLTTPQSDISPPELSKMVAPEVDVASPVKVLSLRSRKVHVSPSPQKRTPRGRKPKNN